MGKGTKQRIRTNPLEEEMGRKLDAALPDDEPDDDDFDGGLTEARKQTPIPHEEACRRLLDD